MRSIGIAHIKIVLSWKDWHYIFCQDDSVMRFLVQIISWSSVKEGPGFTAVWEMGGVRYFYRQEALFVLAAAEGCTAHSSPLHVGQNG